MILGNWRLAMHLAPQRDMAPRSRPPALFPAWRPWSNSGRGQGRARGRRAAGHEDFMTLFRHTFAIRVARDRAVEAISFATLCGAVVCAGVALGPETAGGVALLAVWMRPRAPAERYRELRFDGDAWEVVGADGGVVPVEPPVVHLAHRALVVLEVAAGGRSDFLVFSPAATPAEDLRRLRVRLRAGRPSR